jgi:hypothetical protein
MNNSPPPPPPDSGDTEGPDWPAIGRGVKRMGRVWATNPLLGGLQVKALKYAGRSIAAAGNRNAPGWYDDPKREARLRWWDGRAWTDSTHEGNEETK